MSIMKNIPNRFLTLLSLFVICSGRITENPRTTTVLIIAVVLSLAVAIKRMWLGLFLGKKTYGELLKTFVWHWIALSAHIVVTLFTG
jgi:hypothetical protein